MDVLHAAALSASLRRQRRVFEGAIVLTPVDSFPIYDERAQDADLIDGLYATDRPRDAQEVMSSKIFFGGRSRLTSDIRKIYDSWARALGAAESSLRLLSGLHAHVTVFMALGHIGDTIMILPEIAGGHFATPGILKRLGYKVVDMPVDLRARCIDKPQLAALMETVDPDIVFVDRSEGLNYEDFSQCFEGARAYRVFDASQYLSGILTGLYKTPFEMGFDLLISTLHKSFPGPQKALVATRHEDPYWDRVKGGLSAFVSSFHARSTYLAGFALAEVPRLRAYASLALENAVSLEDALAAAAVPVVRRAKEAPPTQHIWIAFDSALDAYRAFRELERCRIYVNYRLLPYGLGYGLRLGTTAATARGFRACHADQLAEIIANTLSHGFSLRYRHAVRDLANAMASANDDLRGRAESGDWNYDGSDSLLIAWERGDWSGTPPPPSVHSPGYRALVLSVVSRLPVPPGASLVSLGCGNAFIEAELAARGLDVLATDTSSQALALANAKGLRTRYVDALHIPDNLGRFDLVYADGLAGHLFTDPFGPGLFANTLSRLVRDGGFIVLGNDLSNTDVPTSAVTGRPAARFFRGTPGEIPKRLLDHLRNFRLIELETFDYIRPKRGVRSREVAVLQRIESTTDEPAEST
jgi:glycine hydroxymethyltransferase